MARNPETEKQSKEKSRDESIQREKNQVVFTFYQEQ
jgi:hypothetical protein